MGLIPSVLYITDYTARDNKTNTEEKGAEAERP